MRPFLEIPYELRQYIYANYVHNITVRVIARPISRSEHETQVVYPFMFVFEKDVDHNAVLRSGKTIANCRSGTRINLTLLGTNKFVRHELMTLLIPLSPLEISVQDLSTTYELNAVRQWLPRCLPKSYTRHVRVLDVDISFLRNFTGIQSRFKALQKLIFRDETYSLDGVSKGKPLSWISQCYPFDYMREQGFLQEWPLYKVKMAKRLLLGKGAEHTCLPFDLEFIGRTLGYNDSIWGYNYKGFVLVSSDHPTWIHS